MSSDDGDYSVPCQCGGWIHYVEDVQQPHEHRRSPRDVEIERLTAQLRATRASEAALVTELRDSDQDERIKAWHEIAEHPFFRECYLTDDTLLEAMLAKLNTVTAQLEEAQSTIAEALAITVDGRGVVSALGQIRDRLSRARLSAAALREEKE